MSIDLDAFRHQIAEDIELIQENNSYNNYNKPEYAFNHWIISKIFKLDDEIIPDYIVDYSDKGLDCYVSFDDKKVLYLIQNKYYAKGTCVSVKEVDYFLSNPLVALKNGYYEKKSEELQAIFNKAKYDKEYTIYLYFFTTDEGVRDDISRTFTDFNNKETGLECTVIANYFDISAIHELYFGRAYNEKKDFNIIMRTITKGTYMYLQNIEANLNTPYQAYYIVTPIPELYNMMTQADKKDYPIFDKNMREFLGKNTINNAIINTLKDEKERKFFIYYNNGVTIICKDLKDVGPDSSTNMRRLRLSNPQIVNGCQTVSSIREVLKNVPDEIISRNYGDVYVIVKALVIKEQDKTENIDFYNNVVRYTNKQNAIPEKVFVANDDYFFKIQSAFKERGFLLIVKPSDKNTYKGLSKHVISKYIEKANKLICNFSLKAEKLGDIMIDLEKLLQVFVAFMKSGYHAFIAKNQILNKESEIYSDYSTKITEYLTFDNMIRLYWLYYYADKKRKVSDGKRDPIPYYLVGFLGLFIGEKTFSNIKEKLDIIFSDSKMLEDTFSYISFLTSRYRKTKAQTLDYNVMIKKPVDNSILKTIGGEGINGWDSVITWIVDEYKS